MEIGKGDEGVAISSRGGLRLYIYLVPSGRSWIVRSTGRRRRGGQVFYPITTGEECGRSSQRCQIDLDHATLGTRDHVG